MPIAEISSCRALLVLPTAEVMVVGNQFNAPDTTTKTPITILGQRIADALPDYVLAEPNWVVVENGRLLSPAEWEQVLRPYSQLVCYQRIGGSSQNKLIIGGILVAAAIASIFFPPLAAIVPASLAMFAGSVGAGLAIGGASEMLMGPPKQLTPQLRNTGEDQSSPTYGFTGIRNSTRNGASIAVVYGEHRVGGQILQSFIRSQTVIGNVTGSGVMNVTEHTLSQQENMMAYIANGGQFNWTNATSPIPQQPNPVTIFGTGTNFAVEISKGEIISISYNGLLWRYEITDVIDHDHMNGRKLEGPAQDHVNQPFSILKERNTSGENDLFFAEIGISEGEVFDLNYIEINGQPSDNFSGIAVEKRYGTNDQSSIGTMFGDVTRTAFPIGTPLTDDWTTYSTDSNNITALEIGFIFQSGLFRSGDNGGFEKASVPISVQYKKKSSGTWLAFGDVTITEAKRSVIRRMMRKNFAPDLGDGYDVRWKRIGAESTGSRVVDAVQVQYVNEILNDAYNYPNLARIGIQIGATEQLSGSAPTITTLVKGVIIRNFSSATAWSMAWTQNPAWIVLDMLTNQRYGAGKWAHPIITSKGTYTATNGSTLLTGVGTEWLTKGVKKGSKIWDLTVNRILTVAFVSSDTSLLLDTPYPLGTSGGHTFEAHQNNLDLQSFYDWAVFCDEQIDDGAGGTEARAQCDYVFDSDNTKVWDAAQKIAGLGFAAVIKVGSYIWIRFQKAEPYRQLFNMANIIKGTFRERLLPLKERANYFEVGFMDRANNYKQDVVTWEDPLLATGSETIRRQSVAVYGCSRRTHAARLALFYAKSNRYLTRTVEFEAFIDAISCQAGDVVAVQHDIPQWGYSTRVGIGSTSSTVVLDTPMTIVVGKTYQVMLRKEDDTLETHTVTNTPGTYTTLTISGSWLAQPVQGQLIGFGETAILVKPFRLLAVERRSDHTVKLSMVEYTDALYDISNISDVSQIQYSVLPDPTGIPGQVTDLLLTQLYDADGTVWVSFNPPAQDIRFATAIIYRQVGEQWQEAGRSRDGTFSGFKGLPAGTRLTVKVVSTNKFGASAPIDFAPVAELIVQVGLPPPVVTGLELAGQALSTVFEGKDAKFRWRDRSAITGLGRELLGYETLGLGNGGSDARFRDYRVEIYDSTGLLLRRREFVVDPLYEYTFEKNYEDGQGTPVRSLMIRVWQRDMYNQISPEAAELVVSNPPPNLVSNFQVYPTFSGILVQYNPSPDLDLLGYKVWVAPNVSLGTGIDDVPNDDLWLKYRGPNTYHNFPLVAGTQYSVRVAAFDSFGEVGLMVSPELFATPSYLNVDLDLPNGSISGSKIEDDSIETPKLRANSVTADKLTSGQLITLAAQIADAVITDAHIANVSADKILANSITADKFISPLWGDLSRAIVYVNDILGVGIDAVAQWTIDEMAIGSTFEGTYLDRYYHATIPRIGIKPVRKWGDGAPFWDHANTFWDKPVPISQVYFTCPWLDLGSTRTGRAEAFITKDLDNAATATITLVLTYQAGTSGQYGTNEPTYDDGQFETMTVSGSVGGFRDRYVGQIRTGVRRVSLAIRLQTSNNQDRIAIIQPELRFNDTRISPLSMNIPTSTTATAGALGALPNIAGYLDFRKPDGTVAKVPYLNP